MWSGERLTRRQVTSRPDHLWPELWIKLDVNAELKERHKWSDEEPTLDNARQLRGIYFIDPEDEEFKESHQESSQEIGNANGSRYALQDKQEQSARCDPW